MSHALETGVTKHAASAQRVKSDLDRLGDEMSQCHLAETKLRQRADQLESSCEGLRARLRDGRTQAEEHAARIKGLESAKADLDDKLLQATSTCTDLDVEKFILETQVRFLDKKLAETVVERNAVSGQLAAAGDRLGHANRQVEALTTKLNGACSLAEYRGVYEDFLLYGLAPDQNPDVSSLQAAHLAIKQFTTSLRSVRTGVRCVARFEVSSLQTAVLEQAHDICFGMLLSACSGRHLHLDTLQRLVVSLRSSDEAEVRQCLPLIFGTVQRLMRKELDFDGRVLILRCLDLLVAYGQSPLLGEVVAHLHAMKAHSGLLCSAYIDWLSEAVDGAPDCLAARIGAEARRQNVMLELNGFGIMVDCDWVLMVHSEHGIAVLRPDQLNVEFDPFGPGTICFRDAPFIGTLAMGYAANQASFVVGCLLPALVNMTSLQS